MSNRKALGRMRYTSRPWNEDLGITILETNDHGRGHHIALVPKDIELRKRIFFCADFDKKNIEQEVYNIEKVAPFKITVLHTAADLTSAIRLLDNLMRNKTGEIVELN